MENINLVDARILDLYQHHCSYNDPRLGISSLLQRGEERVNDMCVGLSVLLCHHHGEMTICLVDCSIWLLRNLVDG